MQTPKRVSTWLIGGASAWLAYAVTLSALHVWLLNAWGVPYSIQIYNLKAPEPLSFVHVLLVGMIAPGYLMLEAISFLHIHLAWLFLLPGHDLAA